MTSLQRDLEDGMILLRGDREELLILKSMIESEVRLQVEANIKAKFDKMMSSVMRELSNGYRKGVIAEALGVSRPTLDRWIKQYKEGRA